MKIKFLAVANAPDKYSFNGYKVTAYYDGDEDTFDFSDLQKDDSFGGVESDLELSNLQIIRKAECDEDGELYVTLCQKAGTGHWTGRNMGWMNADDYESDKTYIEKVGESNGDS